MKPAPFLLQIFPIPMSHIAHNLAGIEICNLSDEELGVLAKKTFILITTVGPYTRYGEHAFKACAENGTHYLDVTGEISWTFKMMKKYEEMAKVSGAIMIPQIGVESAPSDLCAWSLATVLRTKLSAQTGAATVSVYDLRYLLMWKSPV